MDATVTYIHSPVATGYYGRFLASLVARVYSKGYFVICDDDNIWIALFGECDSNCKWWFAGGARGLFCEKLEVWRKSMA